MKFKVLLLLLSSLLTKSCSYDNSDISQGHLHNTSVKEYDFLSCMYQDSYFPTFLVDKCKGILIQLSFSIEKNKPKDINELYVLTHKSTQEINALQNDFFKNGSEIETGARECLALDFEFISKSYGFNAEIEQLIAPREW